MFIDFHTYVGESINGYGQTETDLLSRMGQRQVEYSVICPVQPKTYEFQSENTRIAALAAEHPKLIGFARVDPRLGRDAFEELRRSYEQLRLSGLFLHPMENNFQVTSDFVFPLMEYAAEHNMPVLFAAGFPWVSHPLQVAELAKNFPSIPVIMSNGGQINISGLALRDAWQALDENENLYIHTAGVYREDFIEDVANEFGAARVLFASCSPLFDLDYEIKRVEWAHLSEEDKRLIAFDNARRILGL